MNAARLLLTAGRIGLDFVYPRVCAGCGSAITDGARGVCWDCIARLAVVRFPFCSICGNPVCGAVDRDYVCQLCRKDGRHFDRARSAVHFDAAAAPILHCFKYSNAVHLAGDLAGLLLACVRTHYAPAEIDAVTFVPLHPARERERSYNQSRLLAVRAARGIGRPQAPECLRRTRPTGSQTGLNARERRDNVRGAFKAVNRGWIAGRRFLLVDDVMTTGATVDECARMLKDAGAASVAVATVARGLG